MDHNTHWSMTPTDPRQLLNKAKLSTTDRRELLAHWMSDIHAVPDHPALRRLDDGTVFHIDDLSEALQALDGPTSATIIPFRRAVPLEEDDDPSPGASAMWPLLPPVVTDARAAVARQRYARAQ
jgi:hypothetical protein